MAQSFSYSVTTSLPRERVWQTLTNVENWSKFSCVYRDLEWVGSPWAIGSCVKGHLKYPLAIPFRYLLREFVAPTLIRYLADSPELGFANERTIHLEELSHKTLIAVNAFTVGSPICMIPDGSLGFLRMLTVRWFDDLAKFCDEQVLTGGGFADQMERSDTKVVPIHEHSSLPNAILRSWKDIAQYMGTCVKTVQRWEHTYNFPVRRVDPKKGSVVLAFKNEVDAWLRTHAELRNDKSNFPDF